MSTTVSGASLLTPFLSYSSQRLPALRTPEGTLYPSSSPTQSALNLHSLLHPPPGFLPPPTVTTLTAEPVSIQGVANKRNLSLRFSLRHFSGTELGPPLRAIVSPSDGHAHVRAAHTGVGPTPGLEEFVTALCPPEACLVVDVLNVKSKKVRRERQREPTLANEPVYF